MNRFVLQFLAIAAMILALAGSARAQVLSSPELKWQMDRRAALGDAKKSGKPLIVYLYTRRALACRDMEQETYRNKAVVDMMKNFVLVGIDLAVEPDLKRSLNVIKVPTTIFYNVNGQELYRAVGYKQSEVFMDYLKALVPASAGGSGAAGAAAASASAYNPSALAMQKRTNTATTKFQFYSPNARKVILAGDFNDWDEKLYMMKKQANGWWAMDLFLPNGIYEYKFIADGEWHEDPTAKFRKFVEGYNTYNSVAVVGQVPQRPLVRNGKVTFLLYDRDAKEAFIAGVWTNWQPVKMFSKGDGNFGIQYDLPRGTYQYKFVVNGEWRSDPGNLFEEPDANGVANSVVHVQ